MQLNGSCPAFDRLIGSRVAVANAELRFPLWGGFGGKDFYGPIPVELAVFSDAGVAWGRSSSSFLTRSDREPVVSVGAAARINLFGFAVAEIDYVRPLDRPPAAAGCGSSVCDRGSDAALIYVDGCLRPGRQVKRDLHVEAWSAPPTSIPDQRLRIRD